MDFSDLDTSLKITNPNTILYSNWLYNNRISIADSTNRSNFITSRIGFVESNPGAIISFLKKTGLVTSTLEVSPYASLVATEDLTYAELCIIHLSKESLFLNGQAQVNLLSVLCKYALSLQNGESIDLQKVRELDENLVPIQGNRNSNSRTDYILTQLEGTNLFIRDGKVDDGKVKLTDKALPIITYLASLPLTNCTHALNSPNRFDYFSSLTGGILDFILDSVPVEWNELYPHLTEHNIENIKKRFEKKASTIVPTNYDKYLRALRTKPFMLLAGISGTGKSRIVRELAFKSCPPYLRDADGTTPGNYLMVEVKPNWHDSSELLGYYSHLANNGNGGYVFTPFTKFLVKAMMFPNVPFFVCLDEMNLAPVEQYFAEFLSVLETRKHDKDNYIQTGVLVKPEYFQGISDHVGDGYICTEFFPDGLPKIDYPVYTNTILTNKGLSLLDNVFIIGTVNMDDTTHQFSRKVIDRAMTIEMNGGKLTEMFGHSADLEYLPADQVWELEKFLPQYVNADEVVAAHPEYEWLIQTQLPAILEDINDVLRDTPFQVSYRVLNEMVIYFSVLVESGMPSEEAKNLAVDQMLLMKILPRIEGDRDMLMLDAQTCRLDKLEPFATSEETKKKIVEMKNRLNKQEFTRFWP